MTKDPFDIPPLERDENIAREERVRKMIPRTEPSDKLDRDEIDKDLSALCCSYMARPGLATLIRRYLNANFVPRSEHERIVGELKEELKRKIREAIEKAYPAPDSVGGSELDMLITVLEEIVDKK